MTKSECGLLCSQLKSLKAIYEERTNEIGVDISAAEQKELLRGRKQKRRQSVEIGLYDFKLILTSLFTPKPVFCRQRYNFLYHKQKHFSGLFKFLIN